MPAQGHTVTDAILTVAMAQIVGTSLVWIPLLCMTTLINHVASNANYVCCAPDPANHQFDDSSCIVYHASWCNEGIAVCVVQGQVMLVWPHQMYLTGITAGVIMEIIAGFWNVWTM